jgi:cellulose synthase/poly-beta-1,6-N-acetylglucosamine synthase-like glycosyltransferase
MQISPNRIKTTVAVLLAAKDCQDKLGRTMDSLTAQTLDPKLYSVCAYDDGSSDATPELLKEYERSGKCVFVGRNATSIGLTKTLNVLLRESESEFIARVDSGDVCAATRLERQLEYLQTNPDVAAVCSSVELFVPPAQSIGPLFEPLGSEIRIDHLRYKNPIVHGSVMLRRKVLDSVGVYDENCRFAQDLDLWLRILQAGQRIHWIKEPLYLLEADPHGISATKSESQAATSDQIRSRLLGGSFSSLRRMQLGRMLGLARLRRFPIAGDLFRLAESLVYEIRSKVS